MQYVNDDMDELFRKAAENYPLDTTGSDWNKVLAGLQGQENAEPPAKRKGRNRFLWLLLLLPMGLVCNYYYQNRVGLGDLKKSNGDQPNIVSSGPKSNTSHNISHVPGSNGEILPGTDANLKTTVPVEQGNDNVVNNNHNGGSVISGSEINSHVAISNTTTNQKAGNHKNKNEKSAFSGQKYYTVKTNTSSIGGNLATTNGSGEMYSSANSSFTGFIHPNYFPGTWNYNAPGTHFKPVSKESVNKNNQAVKPKRFYVGLMGGIDLTTIHFQKLTQNGYDYGALLGYKIGSKWSVEAAAFMDKKYYYTDGKYYKNGNIYMPPYTSITDIEGWCKMWDVSLGGTYSFVQKQKSSWFAAAGMSSYLMKKENYDYTYYYATSGSSAVHNKQYENASKNYFSIINLSAGYTRRLGKNADLRVEPYLKVPVTGVGVGNLPLFSGGIHIGVTSKLF